MKSDDILKMVEGSNIEFKEIINESVFRTLSAFANTNGGKLYVGISDRKYIKGFDCRNSIIEDLTNKIVKKLGIHPQIDCIEVDDKKVLKLEVKKSTLPVSYEGRYYKRVGNTTREMQGEELRVFFIKDTNWDGLTGDYSLDDRIWFFNIGGLPEGITLNQLKFPHPSVARNPLIVHVFYLAGLIEEYGSGIGRILKSTGEAGIPEPEFKEEFGGFSVYIRKDSFSEDKLKERGLNDRQIRAVMYVKENRRITNKEYREMFDISDRMALIDLSDICAKNIFERIGKTGRNIEYILSRNKPEKPAINPK